MMRVAKIKTTKEIVDYYNYITNDLIDQHELVVKKWIDYDDFKQQIHELTTEMVETHNSEGYKVAIEVLAMLIRNQEERNGKR